MYTVYALISFRKFKTLASSSSADGKSEAWYALPEGYTMKTFDDIAASKKGRRSESWDAADQIPEATSAEDAKVLKQMGL